MYLHKKKPAALQPSGLLSEGSNSDNTEQITLKCEKGVVGGVWNGSSSGPAPQYFSAFVSYESEENSFHFILYTGLCLWPWRTKLYLLLKKSWHFKIELKTDCQHVFFPAVVSDLQDPFINIAHRFLQALTHQCGKAKDCYCCSTAEDNYFHPEKRAVTCFAPILASWHLHRASLIVLD